MKHQIDLLDNINKVEAPPYLLTRINQKIRATKEDNFSKNWVVTLGLSLFVLVILNTQILINNNDYLPSQEESFAESMNLTTNNTLYR
jgi:hypothetical protein